MKYKKLDKTESNDEDKQIWKGVNNQAAIHNRKLKGG